jgi:hypothetical protein
MVDSRASVFLLVGKVTLNVTLNFTLRRYYRPRTRQAAIIHGNYVHFGVGFEAEQSLAVLAFGEMHFQVFFLCNAPSTTEYRPRTSHAQGRYAQNRMPRRNFASGDKTMQRVAAAAQSFVRLGANQTCPKPAPCMCHTTDSDRNRSKQLFGETSEYN